VNLNLLLAFDALLRERSVTRAARSVGVTQAAMSNSLAQLRTLFEDPLFIRRSHGMDPTSRALQVGEQVQQGLASFEAALAPAVFNPAHAEHSFVIAMNDYCQQVVLPPLLERVAHEAPKVRLAVRHWGHHQVSEALARGKLDLLLGFFASVPDNYFVEPLFEERFVCIVRTAHPKVRTRLTLKRYLSLGHVVVSVASASPTPIDLALERLGHQRRVSLTVANSSTVPFVVARTDFIAAVSARTAVAMQNALPLSVFPLPVELEPSRIRQAWHARTQNDPRQRWLRDQVRDVCRAV
jgi:DNA-binding transcriptional LysR family regulator